MIRPSPPGKLLTLHSYGDIPPDTTKGPEVNGEPGVGTRAVIAGLRVKDPSATLRVRVVLTVQPRESVT